MALNIVSATTTPIGLARAIRIQNNIALTGTIIVAATGSTQYGTGPTTLATITNPTVGQTYAYGGLQAMGPITITTSATCDITITKVNRLS